MSKPHNPIRSVNGIQVIPPSAFQHIIEDVSAPSAGRTEDVTMHKKRIGQVVGIELAWQNVTTADCAAILQAFNSEYLTVEYLDAIKGDYVTAEFYVGNRTTPLYNAALQRWSRIAFKIVMRKAVADLVKALLTKLEYVVSRSSEPFELLLDDLDGITLIKERAFDAAIGLTSITIPSSVTVIGNWAFRGCTGLTGITCLAITPPALRTDVFSGVPANCAIYVPASSVNAYKAATNWAARAAHIQAISGTIPTSDTAMTTLKQVVSGTSNPYVITAVKLSGITGIGKSALSSCFGMTSITIPDSVTSIGDSVFSYCYGLTNITIPDSVTSIGDTAFEYCTSMTNITIPNSVISLGTYTFYRCTNLTNIIIPNAVTRVGTSMFSGCTGLKNITIGSGVTIIDGNVFYGCTALRSITCQATNPPLIQASALSGVPANCAIYVPSGSVDAYKAATNWSARAAYIQAI